MFDVGFWELVLISGLGLLILGPEKLPRVANKIGRWVGKARRTAGDLRRQLERELDFDDLAGKKNYHRPKPPPPPPSGATPEPPITDHAPLDDDEFEVEPDVDVAADDEVTDPVDLQDEIEAADAPAPESIATSSSK